MPQQAIVIDPGDSIAVALADLAEGQKCVVRVGNSVKRVRLRDRIPFGHKFALYPIPKGTQVRNCGEVIGESTEDIEQGSIVDLRYLATSLEQRYTGERDEDH